MTSPVNSKNLAAHIIDNYPSAGGDNRNGAVSKTPDRPISSDTELNIARQFDSQLVLNDETKRQASVQREMDAIEEAKAFIAKDKNIGALLATVPQSVTDSNRPKLIQQIGVSGSEDKAIWFDILNYTVHSLKFDESLSLLIDGQKPKESMGGQILQFPPLSSQLIVFDYLGQLYLHGRSIPKQGESASSTKFSALAFNLSEKEVLFHRSRLQGMENIILKAKQTLRESLASVHPSLATKETDIELISAESVVFTNSSLGVPRPGRCSLGSFVDGFILTLRYSGKTYRLHTGEGSYFVSPDLDLSACREPWSTTRLAVI